MRLSQEQLDALFVEYRKKLERYCDASTRNYYWQGTPPEELRITTMEAMEEWLSNGGWHIERERRGMENHRLHVEAYEAGEIFRGALRSLFTSTPESHA